MDIKKRKIRGDGWRFGKKRQREKTIKVTPLKSPHSSRLKTSIHPVQSPFWAGSKEEELQGDRKEVKKRVVSTTTCPCGSCGTGGIGGTGAACPRQQASLLRQQATWRGGLSYSTPDYTVSRGIVLSNHRQVETQNSITYMPIYYSMFINGSSGISPSDTIIPEVPMPTIWNHEHNKTNNEIDFYKNLIKKPSWPQWLGRALLFSRRLEYPQKQEIPRFLTFMWCLNQICFGNN